MSGISEEFYSRPKLISSNGPLRLSELSTISTKVDRLFEECTRERLITSDGVLKVVVTALAALWHARLARSKILNGTSASLSQS